MALTFRSSTPEERLLIERGKNGDQRVCRAVQLPHNVRQWDITLEHPSGRVWKGAYSGDGNTVYVAMTQMMMDREHDYHEDRARSHRPLPPVRDKSVQVHDHLDETFIRQIAKR